LNKGIFIIGTDTDVGKTFVTAGINYVLKKNNFNVISFKPVQSGGILKENKIISGDIKNLGEYRQIGMIGAIELVKNKNTKEGFDWKERVGYHIYKIALEKGVLLRPLGNVVYFMPPYVINEKEIDLMINTAIESISEYFKYR